MSDEPGAGAASSITRGGFGFIGITTAAAVGNCETFNFVFAGGFISGTVGVYEVYCSADNGKTDTWEPLQKDGTNVEVEVISGVKNVLPEAMFNVGPCRLVGPAGSVNIHGAG